MNDVCVLGLGYIGLPTAALLATHGYRVLGVDTDARVIETINQGGIHIEEPGLHTLVRAATQSGNLRAAAAPAPCDVFIIAVPTPITADKKADMGYVEGAARAVTPVLKSGNLVILESTSPPGACEKLVKPILEDSGMRVGADIGLAHCPERVLPGRILNELIANDRIIGGIDAASAERARALYARFVEGEIFLTDATTAEMVKVTENTFRDVNIALANETALLCEQLGIDCWEVARLANRHPRVNLHAAGPGVGGHCISVDPWFLVERFPDTARLIALARERNDAMPEHVVQTTLTLLKDVECPVVAALGLAYKGNVDDIRESPAVKVIALLEAAGCEVRAHDPHVRHASITNHERNACIQGADCLLVLTAHAAFQTMDPTTEYSRMRTPILFDAHNLMDHAAWRAAGFVVQVLGARQTPSS